MPKIAVLISGDYRLFEECFYTYKHLLVGTDVYFSTWSTTEIVHPNDNTIQYSTTINKEKIEKLFLNFNLVDICVEDYHQTLWNNFRYNSAMVYRWNKGIDMIKKSKIDYDYILIIRPDLFVELNANINWKEIQDNELHEAWYSRKDKLTDLCIAGKFSTILSVIPTLNEWNSSKTRDWHTMFYNYVTEKSVKVFRLNFVDCVIGRPGKFPLISYQNAFSNFEYWRNSTIENQIFKYGSKRVRELWTDKLYDSIFFNELPSAIIFDLDGVISDTGKLHYRALKESVSNITGLDIDYRDTIGADSMLSTKDKIGIIKEYYSLTDGVCDQILTKKDTIFNNLVNSITIDDNVLSVLNYLKSLGIRLAIASNSRKYNIDNILNKLQIGNYFDTVVSADDVINRKPASDILFKVYKNLNLTDKECIRTLFVEDTEQGATAGYKSPSTTLKINNPSELSIELFNKWVK